MIKENLIIFKRLQATIQLAHKNCTQVFFAKIGVNRTPKQIHVINERKLAKKKSVYS